MGVECVVYGCEIMDEKAWARSNSDTVVMRAVYP